MRKTKTLVALGKTLYLTSSLHSVTLARLLFTLLCARLLCTELHRVEFFTGNGSTITDGSLMVMTCSGDYDDLQMSG